MDFLGLQMSKLKNKQNFKILVHIFLSTLFKIIKDC